MSDETEKLTVDDVKQMMEIVQPVTSPRSARRYGVRQFAQGNQLRPNHYRMLRESLSQDYNYGGETNQIDQEHRAFAQGFAEQMKTTPLDKFNALIKEVVPHSVFHSSDVDRALEQFQRASEKTCRKMEYLSDQMDYLNPDQKESIAETGHALIESALSLVKALPRKVKDKRLNMVESILAKDSQAKSRESR